MAHTRRDFLKTAAAGAAATGALGFPMVSRAQQKKLTVSRTSAKPRTSTSTSPSRSRKTS
jgi:anaerobic selenocysteine-containing dehydrogenase